MIQLEYQKWVSKLLGYNFEVQFRPGLENKAADALLRLPLTTHLASLTTLAILDFETVQKEMSEDQKLQQIVFDLLEDPASHSKFSIHQDTLLYKGHLVLSADSKLLPTVLHTYHDSVFGGHFGFLRTYKQMTAEL